MCQLTLMNPIPIRRATIDDLSLISPLFDLYKQFYEEDSYLLNDLYVVESHRRLGVGALLLETAVAHAQSEQAVRISLTTNVANTTAQAVYEAQGWEREKAFLTYNFKLNP